MGYLFLSIALAVGGLKGYCGKKTSNDITLKSDSMVMNNLRMGICVIIGLLLILIQGEIHTLLPSSTVLLIALLSGVSTAAFVVSWLLSVKSGAYMMVEVFLLIGVIVPIVLCRIFYNEEILTRQIIAIGILLIAVYIMCTYNSSIKGKMKPSELVLLLICGISNGFADFSQKVFVKTAITEAGVAVFNLYTYLFAGLALLFASYIFRKKEKKEGADVRKLGSIVKPIWIYVLIMAVCLFAHSFFKTKAAEYLDAVRLYPLNQGASVLISIFLSSVFFKEKINLKCIVGIVLSFAALLLINL